MLEWIKVIGTLVLSWPVAVVIIVFMFRKHLNELLARFTNSSGSKAEIGPVKFELGKLAEVTEEGKDAVGRLNRITDIMAQSRLLELEITSEMFGAFLPDDKKDRMKQHIEELQKITSLNNNSE